MRGLVLLGVRAVPRFSSYVICTSPRSGSTLLCQLLSATNVAGRPKSYFHPPSVSAWLRSLELEGQTYASDSAASAAAVRAAIRAGTGDTGVFGLRLQYDSRAFLAEQLAGLFPEAETDLDRFQQAFGRVLFIHLTRADKLDQAISYIKASQSGLWHQAPDGREIERLAPHQDPTFDAQAILAQRDEFKEKDVQWRRWFKAQSVKPLQITYDDLSADPNRVLGDILVALGLERALAADVEPGVAKLADETNQQWKARILRENAS